MTSHGQPMRIAVVGNCHGGVVCQAIRHNTDPRDVDARFFKITEGVDAAGLAWIGDADLVLLQAQDCAKPKLPCPIRGRVVPFPLLTAQFLWPFNLHNHPRIEEAKTIASPEGLFNHRMLDSQLMRLIEERGVTPESPQQQVDDLLDDYMALDYSRLIDLDRMLDMTRQPIRRNADVVGYDMFVHVERDLRSKPVFVTRVHPELDLLARLSLEILPRIGIPVSPSGIRRTFAKVYGGEELFVYGAPIHPSVLRHYGIEWPGEPPRFRFHHDGTITLRSFSERVVRFDTRQPATELFNRINMGEPLDIIVPRLAAVVRDDPDNAVLRLHYGNLLASLGRNRDALDHYVAASHLEPSHPGVAARLTEILSRIGAGPAMAVERAGVWYGVGEAGSGVSCLQEGWSSPEPWGSWVLGHQGTMAIDCRALGRDDLSVRFRARAFPAYHGRTMHVSVYANGRLAGLWTFDYKRPEGERSIDLPEGIGIDEPIRLQFFVSHPVSPFALRLSVDPRSFGLGIYEFCVETAAGVEPATVTARQTENAS